MLNFKQQKSAFKDLPNSKRKQVLEVYGSFRNAFDEGLVVYGKRVIIASPWVVKNCVTPKECFDLLDGLEAGVN